MATARIELPPKLIPVFAGSADVRGAYGGRGSGKTRSFAKMAAVEGYRHSMAGTSGIILCARQFMNSLEDSSLEEVKRAIEEEPFLADFYEVGQKYVRSRDGRINFSFAGLDRSIESVKSKGRLLLVWVDEAEPVTDQALSILIPTLREEGEDWNAELWITWNPKRKNAAVERRYRNTSDPRIKVVELNWRDNPRFPEKLQRERLRDLAADPENYAHVWEGDYARILVGAYYARQLQDARAQGRIGVVSPDPLLTTRAYWDIGGTGAKADATAIWIVQFVGSQVRVLDYYEAVGQPLEAHVNWLRDRGYQRAECILPHDGANAEKVFSVSYQSALQAAGFSVRVIPNMGAGAASKRIEAVRRAFPACWFNESTTDPGREALGFYHEKRDEARGVGLGPSHDWSSHGSDAFGLMAVDFLQGAHMASSGPRRHAPRLGVA